MFKIGDRVECIREIRVWGCYKLSGEKGTVIDIMENRGLYTFGVEFDNNICGHSCEGLGKPGHCYWLDDTDLKLAENEPPKSVAIPFETQYPTNYEADFNQNKPQLHTDICTELNDIYKTKNADYGDSFAKLRQEIPEAILVRIYDKYSRLKTLLQGSEQQVKGESIDDTLMDLANYCILELIERKFQNDK